MDIRIFIESNPEPAAEPKVKKPSLKERIEYAIECMNCDHNKQDAISFLQAVKAKYEAEPRQDREFQDMMNLVNVALADYGHYHIIPRKK